MFSKIDRKGGHSCYSNYDLNKFMIIQINSSIDDIIDQGKNFNWLKPNCCPKCDSTKLWGHGYVSNYLNQKMEPLWLKRYRCLGCYCVITCKPVGYAPYKHQSQAFIFHVLKYRFCKLKWPCSVSRQTGGNWIRNFIKKLKQDYFPLQPAWSAIRWLIYIKRKSLCIFP